MAQNRSKLRVTTKSLIFYLVAILTIILISVLTYAQLKRVQKEQKYLTEIYIPSLTKLTQLKLIVLQSDELFNRWLLLERDTASAAYRQLVKLQKEVYYNYKHDMWPVVDNWKITNQNQYYDILSLVDSLFIIQKSYLSEFEYPQTFENFKNLFKTYADILPGGKIFKLESHIIKNIDFLQTEISEELHQFHVKSFQRNTLYQHLIFLSVVAIIVLLLLLTQLFINSFNRDVRFTLQQLNDLVRGTIPRYRLYNVRSQEFIIINDLIEKLSKGLENAAKFALGLAENKFDIEFKPLSRQDLLGNALIKLRENLVRAQKEAELRHIENLQRQWTSQGIAEFSELLREHSNDLDALAKAVIAKLVDYTVANIGGIYIVNDEDPENIIIELRAFYAYDRHKFLKRKFKPGQTLIGQCYLEGQTIYMDDIPEDYITITSGLGKDKPRNLLIVPLKVNEQILGIVELASFQIFEKYQIEFVEKIGESIASAIATVKINIRTQRILKETEEKTRKLEEQERKARNNIAKIEAKLKQVQKELEKEREQLQKVLAERNKLENELKALKISYEKELAEKQTFIDHLLMAINNTLGFYQLDANGNFIDANAQYLKLLNTTKNQIIGTKHMLFISREFINSGNYKKIWDNLKLGKVVNTTVQYLIEGKIKLVSEVYTPILDENNMLKKVIVLSYVS